jgi:hypothetical protein
MDADEWWKDRKIFVMVRLDVTGSWTSTSTTYGGATPEWSRTTRLCSKMNEGLFLALALVVAELYSSSQLLRGDRPPMLVLSEGPMTWLDSNVVLYVHPLWTRWKRRLHATVQQQTGKNSWTMVWWQNTIRVRLLEETSTVWNDSQDRRY